MQNGDILVPANPGPPGNMAVKVNRESLLATLTAAGGAARTLTSRNKRDVLKCYFITVFLL